MGRRSRQRAATGGAPAPSTPAPAPEAPRTPRRRAPVEERPRAPWHPVPLVEISILAGLVLMVVGFVRGGSGGAGLVGAGVAFVALASLETTAREHLTGYRSHTGLLAGVLGVASMAGLGFAGLNRVIVIAIGIIVGVLAFVALRNQFQRKAGGLSWRA